MSRFSPSRVTGKSATRPAPGGPPPEIRGRARLGTLGVTRFPGAVTGLRLHEAPDAYRRPFAFVSTARGGLHTVVIECVGGGLAAPGQTAGEWIRHWLDVTRTWHDPALAGLTLTLDTSRPGSLRVAVTHTNLLPADPAGRKRQRRSDVRDMAVRIGAGIPRICTQLERAVGGAAKPWDARTLIYGARTSFDPSVANLFPDDAPLPSLRWKGVPPTTTQERWDHVQFDGASAATWAMKGTTDLEAPETLLAPATTGIANMRLHVILDRPRLQARPLLRKDDDVALLLTATTTAADPDDARRILDTVPKHLSKDTRWRLRRAYGGQAAAFAAGLGLGIPVPDHLRPPHPVEARR
jgi:hypothetical protein